MSSPGAGTLLAYLSQVPDPRGRLCALTAFDGLTTSWFTQHVDGGGLRIVVRGSRVRKSGRVAA